MQKKKLLKSMYLIITNRSPFILPNILFQSIHLPVPLLLLWTYTPCMPVTSVSLKVAFDSSVTFNFFFCSSNKSFYFNEIRIILSAPSGPITFVNVLLSNPSRFTPFPLSSLIYTIMLPVIARYFLMTIMHAVGLKNLLENKKGCQD